MPDQQPDERVPRDAGTTGRPPDTEGPTTGPSVATTVAGRRSPTRGLTWAVAAATFVVGLLLGALVTGTVDDGGDDDASPPQTTQTAATPAPSPSAPADAAVTVPASCLEVASTAQDLAALVREAAEAAGELDAAELSGIVRQLEETQASLQGQSDRCRAGADPVP